MHPHAELITALTVILIALAMYLVGRARGKFQIKAPATTGHPEFERAFRAHQNTLEQTVMFLPVLWMATLYCDARWAAWFGYAWLLGRLWYLFGYVRTDGGRGRGAGFMLAILATLGLLVMSFCGLLPALLA